jgi:ubiquinone/menaquinone biosynthesis C-methylase UbiE
MDKDYIDEDKYFKFLDKMKLKNNNNCSVDIYKYLYKNKITYPNKNSNIQIKYFVDEIYKTKNITYLNNFIILLTNFISFHSSFQLLNKIHFTKDIKDITILKYIDDLNYKSKKKNTIYSFDDKCSKQQFGFEMIKKKIKKEYLKLELNKIKYLDIGCGDGNKTKLFAKIFNIDSNNIFGTDIHTWGPYKENKDFSFDFKYILKNGKLDYKDDSFDIITCFLTLHHIQNLDLILNEIYRILKKNGLFIIIEHDSLTYFDNLIIEIQHLFFAYFYDNNKHYIKQPFYSQYYNNMEFQYIITHKNKFKLLYNDNFYQNIQMQKRYDQQFYSIFIKK